MRDRSYKQIVVLSGKGGTGKTTLSAAFAGLVRNKMVIDCDVDAANLYLVLKPKTQNSFNFSGGKKAFIEKDKCQKCNLCSTVCRFEAIQNYSVDQLSCEGCGFCFRICPNNAISFNPSNSGSYFECLLNDSSKFYYAKLNPGEGNSGKLVSQIKKKAMENISSDIEWVIVDGPPGIGCPVNASLASADYVVIVTEPTVSGIHDLKRLVKLLHTMKISSGIVINKHDLNRNITNQICSYSKSENIPILGTIPFEKKFINALIKGNNIIDVDPDIRGKFQIIFNTVKSQMEMSINNYRIF